MKKEELRSMLRSETEARHAVEQRAYAAADELKRVKAELEVIKTNWRPVPITHEWQPRNPQCALCDEPRDAARHHVERSVVPHP